MTIRKSGGYLPRAGGTVTGPTTFSAPIVMSAAVIQGLAASSVNLTNDGRLILANAAGTGWTAITVPSGSGTVVGWYVGSGTPEGVVAARVGSFYSRFDGGAGTSFYVKESGAGNTGWVAK